MSQKGSADPDTPIAEQPPVVVKKYANRRLYNTESSSYITLDTLADMVRIGRDFVVYDAKTGDDITRSVLTQIIVEEESKGRALLPTGFLRQLIGFYGDSMQSMVPKYLEQAMSSFARQQQQMRLAMQQTMGNFFPFGIEEVSRQNMAMMERAMSLFTPFLHNADGTPNTQGNPPANGEAMPAPSDDVAQLRAEIESLRGQLAAVRAAPVVPEALAGAPEAAPEPVEPAPAPETAPEHNPTDAIPLRIKRVSKTGRKVG